MRRLLKTIVAFSVIAGVATACGGGQSGQQSIKTYKTQIIDTTSRVVEKSYSATIRGCQDIDIFPQISGRITDVNIVEGQKVKKGDVLFVIDQVPYIAAQKTAEANVAVAEAGVATAQLTYDSNVKLYNEKVISEYELLSSENALLTAKATLAQCEAQLVNANNNLSYTTVTSPANGVAGTIPYREGALVSSMIANPLTTVSDNSRMYVYFSFNETQLLGLVKEYGSADKMLAGLPDIKLQLSDGSIYGTTGRIESISGVIDQSTGAVNLRAAFDNSDRILNSGASGSVVIPTMYDGCIVIPQTATVELQDKIIVYKVVDGKTKATEVKVTTGIDGSEYIVTSGLVPGDIIVVEGVGFIKDNMEISIE